MESRGKIDYEQRRERGTERAKCNGEMEERKLQTKKERRKKQVEDFWNKRKKIRG